jgi:hypothetical protein
MFMPKVANNNGYEHKPGLPYCRLDRQPLNHDRQGNQINYQYAKIDYIEFAKLAQPFPLGFEDQKFVCQVGVSNRNHMRDNQYDQIVNSVFK